MHRIETVRIAKEIVRRFRRAADAGNLGNPMRLDRQLEARLDDRCRDGIVAAAGAQRRDLALAIAIGEAERDLRKPRTMEFPVGAVGRDTDLRSGTTWRRSS